VLLTLKKALVEKLTQKSLTDKKPLKKNLTNSKITHIKEIFSKYTRSSLENHLDKPSRNPHEAQLKPPNLHSSQTYSSFFSHSLTFTRRSTTRHQNPSLHGSRLFCIAAPQEPSPLELVAGCLTFGVADEGLCCFLLRLLNMV